MLHNNDRYGGFNDLDYYFGSAGHNSADNPTKIPLWVDLDAGQMDGEDDRKCHIGLPAKGGRESQGEKSRIRGNEGQG